jgi:hypothetical protein
MRPKRDLLKSYYQQQPEEDVVVEVVVEPLKESKRIDPIDIDSVGYHAELAHNMMMKEQGLVELLQKNHVLVSGIFY